MTLAAYGAALLVRRRYRTPLLHPTLTTIVCLGVALVILHGSYAHYARATRPVSELLGPAVVALAVPLHREREMLIRHARALLLGALLGSASAMAIGLGATQLFHLAHPWGLAVSSRSATSAISIALAGQLHGTAALSAVMSILSGVLGAVVGPWWLTRLGVHEPIARGLAHGIVSHGIGTARMFEEDPLAGATATVGMGLGGLIVALTLPFFF